MLSKTSPHHRQRRMDSQTCPRWRSPRNRCTGRRRLGALRSWEIAASDANSAAAAPWQQPESGASFWTPAESDRSEVPSRTTTVLSRRPGLDASQVKSSQVKSPKKIKQLALFEIFPQDSQSAPWHCLVLFRPLALPSSGQARTGLPVSKRRGESRVQPFSFREAFRCPRTTCKHPTL